MKDFLYRTGLGACRPRRPPRPVSRAMAWQAAAGMAVTGGRDTALPVMADSSPETACPVFARRNEPPLGSGPRLLLEEEPLPGAAPGFLPAAEAGRIGRIVASL